MTLTDEAKGYVIEALGAEIEQALAAFLADGRGDLTKAEALRTSAGQALLLWAVRAENAIAKRVRIEGIQDLVAELKRLDSNMALERFDHRLGRAALTLYRDADSGRPIGYLFVNTPRPDNGRLLDQLGVVRPVAASLAVSAKHTA